MRKRRLMLHVAVVTATVWLTGTGGTSAEPSNGAPGAPRIVNPFEGRAELVEEGRSLFNQYCAHCHAPNAATGERPRDLRRLTLRYGDDAPAVFYTTLNTGRLDKGMPPWKGVLSDETMWRIFTFLQTVQTK